MVDKHLRHIVVGLARFVPSACKANGAHPNDHIFVKGEILRRVSQSSVPAQIVSVPKGYFDGLKASSTELLILLRVAA